MLKFKNQKGFFLIQSKIFKFNSINYNALKG